MPRVQSLTSSTTAFPETKKLASEWLQQCCESHRACNDDHDRENWNPTRLLDVGMAPNATIKLVDSAASTEPLTYITLSHRWGQAKVPQLVKATEARLKTEIPLLDLPKTFQQAVAVVRALDYRYLWIDSLCIRQDRDDLSDWLREASLMHKVYRHGHFNISATGAVDGTEGLFAERDHTAKGHEWVDLQVEGLSGGSTPCIAVDFFFWADNVITAPLNSRGWVLQERILSKRVLHFGKKQLAWECRELQAAETFPDGLIYDGPPRPGIKCLDPLVAGPMMGTAEGAKRDQKFWAHDMWSEIANAYSQCSLTKSEDKVLAIMGIAKHMSELVQDTYVAGMWRRFLASELAWRTLRNAKSRFTHTEEKFIAPSWSWLSQDEEVACGRVSDTGIRLNIRDVQLGYATEDQSGPLAGGRIYLEGILRRIKIYPVRPGTWSLSMPDLAAFAEAGSVEDLVYLDHEPESFETENENGILFCMEVIDDTQWWATLDLLLLRCEDIEKGVYSRIGLCSAHDSRKKLLGDRKRVPDLPCVSWDAVKKMHTICVI